MFILFIMAVWSLHFGLENRVDKTPYAFPLCYVTSAQRYIFIVYVENNNVCRITDVICSWY